MKFRQGHTALTEMAIVFRQAADTGLVSRSERADASSAGLTPGKHRRRMESSLWFGAMAGRVATARFETVDGAFDQLSMPENSGKLALILSRQIIQHLSLAAGEFSGSHRAALALHFTCCSHKACRFSTTPFIAGVVGKVQRKVNDSVIYFFKGPNARAPPSLCPSWLSQNSQEGSHAQNDEHAKNIESSKRCESPTDRSRPGLPSPGSPSTGAPKLSAPSQTIARRRNSVRPAFYCLNRSPVVLSQKRFFIFSSASAAPSIARS